MKESPFGKIVDLLTVVNDLDKRGYTGSITPVLIDSLLVQAVARFNSDFSIDPPNPHIKQNKPVQATPAPVEKPQPAPQPAPRKQREEEK